jgi:hypothetical protein
MRRRRPVPASGIGHAPSLANSAARRRRSRRRPHGPATRCRRSPGSGRATCANRARIAISLIISACCGQQQRRGAGARPTARIPRPRQRAAAQQIAMPVPASSTCRPRRTNRPCGRHSRIAIISA